MLARMGKYQYRKASCCLDPSTTGWAGGSLSFFFFSLESHSNHQKPLTRTMAGDPDVRMRHHGLAAVRPSVETIDSSRS